MSRLADSFLPNRQWLSWLIVYDPWKEIYIYGTYLVREIPSDPRLYVLSHCYCSTILL